MTPTQFDEKKMKSFSFTERYKYGLEAEELVYKWFEQCSMKFIWLNQYGDTYHTYDFIVGKEFGSDENWLVDVKRTSSINSGYVDVKLYNSTMTTGLLKPCNEATLLLFVDCEDKKACAIEVGSIIDYIGKQMLNNRSAGFTIREDGTKWARIPLAVIKHKIHYLNDYLD